MKNKKNLLALSIATLLVSDAIAQGDNTPRKGAAALLMEEVKVMARKRSSAEAAQAIPLAVSAYGSEQLDALFVKKLDDLNFAAPNVQLETVGSFPGVQNFSIRGQGINSSIPSVDPTVGTFVDGIYLGVTYGQVMDMFDVESVEVLRGPQGLLFGRNVTGGAVVLRTARPDGEFGYRARVQVTDSDQTSFAGTIEGSLIEDKLAAKLVVYHDNDEGYYDSQTVAPSVPGVRTKGSDGKQVGALETNFVRPTFVWQVTDTTEQTFIFESGKAQGDGAPWTQLSLQSDGEGTLDDFATLQDEKGQVQIRWDSAVSETNWDVALGGGTVTNILGWRQVDVMGIADVDGSAASILSLTANTQQEQLSNELRYAGSFMGGALQLTTGLYYFEQDIHYREERYLFDGTKNVAVGGDMDHKTWGVFVNNDYSITDALTLTAGIRYTSEKKDSQVIVGSADGSTPECEDVASFNCEFRDLNGSWTNWTPKLGFNYALNDDALLYAFWSKGFRSGGVNFRNTKPRDKFPIEGIAPGPTKEEGQNVYEIGIKSELFDRRLRLNASYFYNTIDDIQRELNQSDADVVVLQGTVNAGDVTIQGVEVDFVALLGDNFALNGSIGWLQGRYTEINPEYDDRLALKGDLPRLSPWTASLGATYDMTLGDKGSLTLRASYSFRDRAAYNDINSLYFKQQHEVGASINYLSPDEHWKVSLFGKNLNDETRYGNLLGVGNWVAGPMQKGRTFGVEVDYTY